MGEVVIFSTCYGDYNQARVPRAAVRVLEHQGYRVLRPEQVCCGMPNLDGSDVDALERTLGLDVLGEKIPARIETRGVLPDRTTAVHYLKFSLGETLAARLAARIKEEPRGAVHFLVDHQRLAARKEMPAATLQSLLDDLAP